MKVFYFIFSIVYLYNEDMIGLSWILIILCPIWKIIDYIFIYSFIVFLLNQVKKIKENAMISNVEVCESKEDCN